MYSWRLKLSGMLALFGIILCLRSTVGDHGPRFNDLYAKRLQDQETRGGEFCDTEVFHGECPSGSIILITSARYGRMRVGRCVEFHLGYINCFSEVTLQIDSRCSGRRFCKVRVPDAELEATRPCLKELKTYLEIHYVCLPVTKFPTHSCKKQEMNMTSQVGYIMPSNISFANHNIERKYFNCMEGLETSIWWILGRPGQNVLLVLYDFSVYSRNLNGLTSSRTNSDSCNIVYGWYADGATASKPICSSGKRVTTLVRSMSHSLKLWFERIKHRTTTALTTNNEATSSDLQLQLQQENFTDSPSFMIKYSIHGCPDIHTTYSTLHQVSSSSLSSLPSPLSSLSLISFDPLFFESSDNGNKLKVGCVKGQWRWILTCSPASNTWIGQVGNCSELVNDPDEQKKLKNSIDDVSISYGVAIVAGGAVGVLIAFLIILIISCNRSRRLAPRGHVKHSASRDYTKVGTKCSCLVGDEALYYVNPKSSVPDNSAQINKTTLTSVSFTVFNESKEPLLVDRNVRMNSDHHPQKEQQFLISNVPCSLECPCATVLPVTVLSSFDFANNPSRKKNPANITSLHELQRFSPQVKSESNFDVSSDN